jgi:hypothetical protein
LVALTVAPNVARAQNSFQIVNPFGGLNRVPVKIELEPNVGGFSGLGSAHDSSVGGAYGAHLTVGVFERMDFSARWLYSDHVRSADIGDAGFKMVSNSLNMFYGTADLSIAQSNGTRLYLSPGVGFTRYGDRRGVPFDPQAVPFDMLQAGTAPSFSIGFGLKTFVQRRIGLRLEVRQHFIGPGVWDFTGFQLLQPSASPTRDFPVQKGLQFGVGVTFRLR